MGALPGESPVVMRTWVEESKGSEEACIIGWAVRAHKSLLEGTRKRCIDVFDLIGEKSTCIASKVSLLAVHW